MNRLTPEQRLQIVQIYYENNGSVRATHRALRPIFGRHNRPSESLIRLTMDRFRTTFTLVDNTHPQRRRTVRTEDAIAVWCALWAEGIIGPYFFKNEAGHNVTVNGERYRAMINDFFVPELDDVDVDDLWFQQDGATCHTANATIDLLKETFGERIISRRGPVAWPPRSCDITPLDYFLWGYVKSLVYADKPETIDVLEENIRRVIADIRPQLLQKVVENWASRLEFIRASRGGHLPEIIFKT